VLNFIKLDTQRYSSILSNLGALGDFEILKYINELWHNGNIMCNLRWYMITITTKKWLWNNAANPEHDFIQYLNC